MRRRTVIDTAGRPVAERENFLRPFQVDMAGCPACTLDEIPQELSLGIRLQKGVVDRRDHHRSPCIADGADEAFILCRISRGLEVEIDADRERPCAGNRGNQLGEPCPVCRRHRRQTGLFQALRIDENECNLLMGTIQALGEIMDEPIFGPMLRPFRQVIVPAEIVDGKRLHRDNSHDRCNRDQ